jgi:hypothetical protein
VKEHLTNLDDSSVNPQSRQRRISDLTCPAAVSSSVIILEALICQDLITLLGWAKARKKAISRQGVFEGHDVEKMRRCRAMGPPGRPARALQLLRVSSCLLSIKPFLTQFDIPYD